MKVRLIGSTTEGNSSALNTATPAADVIVEWTPNVPVSVRISSLEVKLTRKGLPGDVDGWISLSTAFTKKYVIIDDFGVFFRESRTGWRK